jgi:hypothetical protein
MSLRTALATTFARVLAIGCASTGLVAFTGLAAQAASFDLSYVFHDGTAFSALLDGDLGADGNSVSVSKVKSVALKNGAGQTVDFTPGDLAFSSSLTLDGGFVSFGLGSLSANGTDEVGMTLFNTAGVNGLDLFFADLGYLTGGLTGGGSVRKAEAFSYSAYSLRESVPDNVSTPVLLVGLVGMGLAAQQKHRQKQNAQIESV